MMQAVSVADPGSNPAMAPHRSWQWSLPPLAGRKNNESSVNFKKIRVLTP